MAFFPTSNLISSRMFADLLLPLSDHPIVLLDLVGSPPPAGRTEFRPNGTAGTLEGEVNRPSGRIHKTF